jgi:hypothetical protein
MTAKENFELFGKKKIKEIKLWIIAATVIPTVSLSGLFFVWVFGTRELLDIVMIVGATSMFTIAVIWWWWAIHAIYNLLILWKRTDETMVEVKVGITEVRAMIQAVFITKDK